MKIREEEFKEEICTCRREQSGVLDLTQHYLNCPVLRFADLIKTND